MRNWERAHPEGLDTFGDGADGHFVSLSREVGLGGREIASLLSDNLGWPIYGKELLQLMAEGDPDRLRRYESMDQRDLGFLEDILLSFTSRDGGRNDYFHRLDDTVHSIVKDRKPIFIGRATDLILSRDKGLRVRLTAGPDFRMESYIQDHDLSEEEARKQIAQIEKEREQFFQNHFHVGSDDASRHDLVLNVERFSADDCVGMILEAMRRRSILTARG
jgi:cytidylate kinase